MSTRRSVDAAIRRLRESNDSAKRESAARKLADDDGEESLSALLTALGDPYLYVKIASVESLVKRKDRRAIEPLIQAFIQATDNDAIYLQGKIVKALTRLKATESLPVLVSALNSQKSFIVKDISAALVTFGASAVNYLADSLENPDPRIRDGVSRVLGQIGHDAVPVLVPYLSSTNPEVRLAAITALGETRDSDAREPLLGVLSESDPPIVEAAARSLGQVGGAAATSALIGVMQSGQQRSVRSAAAAALAVIRDDNAIDPLVTALADDELRPAAENSLLNFRSPATGPLADALSHHDAAVRESAARVLGRLGPDGVRAATAKLQDRRMDSREAAVSALAGVRQVGTWLGPWEDAEPIAVAVETLKESLFSGDIKLRGAAATAVGVLGGIAYANGDSSRSLQPKDARPWKPVADLALQELLEASSDVDFTVRAASVTALGELGHPDAAGPLLSLIRDPHGPLRTVAACAFVLLPEEAASDIRQGIEDPDPEVVRLIALGITRAVTTSSRRTGVPALRWLRTRNDYQTGHLVQSVASIIDALRNRADDDGRTRDAVLGALQAILRGLSRLRFMRSHSLALAVGVAAAVPLPQIEPVEEISARSTIDAAAERARVPRYADIRIVHDEVRKRGEVVEHTPLVAGQWYRLQLGIRERPTGLPATEDRREPIREPDVPGPVRVMVTAESDRFEIDEPVQSLMLPRQGDASQTVSFRIRSSTTTSPEADLAKIRLRLYCEFALLAVQTIEAEIVGRLDEAVVSQRGLKEPILIREERLGGGLVSLGEILPRAMSISVAREGPTTVLHWVMKADATQLAFTTPMRVGSADLEDAVTAVRTLWTEVALSETFMKQLECGEDEFVAVVRKLALAGRRLWTMLFRRDTASAIFAVGKWLEEQPFPEDSVIRVVIEDKDTDLVFPWSLLYDYAIPPEDYKLPSLEGFWGYRYQIEQLTFDATKADDSPAVVNQALRLTYMLWEPFRNAASHTRFIESLAERSSGRILISRPPVTEAGACLNEIARSDSEILYFYTHGHTRTRSSDVGAQRELDLFMRRYETLAEDDQRRTALSFVYDAIRASEFEVDRSWIELTYGKVYLDSLYEFIEQPLREKAVVFLNMCESAQVTPSLTDSFFHFFLNRGAGAVVGTECPMTLEFAHPFAKWCLESLMRGETIGAAMLHARRSALKFRNPLGLAYTHFGSAMMRFEPALLVDETKTEDTDL